MPGTRVVVRTSSIGIRRMLGQPFLVREIDARGEAVRRLGVFTSPYLTGEYSRSWFKFTGLANGIAHTKVGNRCGHSWFVERGTKNDDGTTRMAPRYVVQKALRAASGRRRFSR